MIARIAVVVALVLSLATVFGLTVWQEARWSMARHVYLPLRLTQSGDLVYVEVNDVSNEGVASGDDPPIEQMGRHHGWVVLRVDERGVANSTVLARQCPTTPGVVCARSSMYGVSADLLMFEPLDGKTVSVRSLLYAHLRVLESGEALVEGYSDRELQPVGSGRRAW